MALQRGPACVFIWSTELEQRVHHAISRLTVQNIAAQLVNVVVERVELVKLALRDGVELVIVTARTADRQTEEGHAGCADAIDDGFDAVLFVVDAPFSIDHRVALKAGGHQLIPRRVRQQIPGNLFNGELVERLVLV